MKILYAAAVGGTAQQRLDALRRLGHEVEVFDFSTYLARGGRVARWLRWRTLMGEAVNRLNSDLLGLVQQLKPSLVWLDKAQMVRPATIRAIKALGVTSVHYSSDLPVGTRGDPGWRGFRAAVSEYDYLLMPSEGHFATYQGLGARKLLQMPFGYDPLQHYPALEDRRPHHDVVFIGTPYEDRAVFLLGLVERHGIKVKVYGDLWPRELSSQQLQSLNWQPGCYGDAYREAIWSGRICLGMVTHAMAHGSARRWTEIAACGGFLLAERTEEAEQWFEAGVEAEFFSDVDECAAYIQHYLDAEEERLRIAKAGYQRVFERMSNDHLLSTVLNQLQLH